MNVKVLAIVFVIVATIVILIIRWAIKTAVYKGADAIQNKIYEKKRSGEESSRYLADKYNMSSHSFQDKDAEHIAEHHTDTAKMINSNFCTSCGAMLKENAKFCTKCGSAVNK